MLYRTPLKRHAIFFSSYIGGVLVSFLLIFFALFIFYKLLYFQGDSKTFFDKEILHTLFFTLFQAFLSTIFSLIFGTIIALSLFYIKEFPFRGIVITVISSTLVLPSIVIVLGIITVFGRNGWINEFASLFGINLGAYIYGLSGILLAHIYFNASYSARVLLNALESIPLQKFKISKTLGLSSWQRFLYIELYELKPYLYSLFSIVFLLCFSSFVIVLTLGGSPSYNTLEVSIYEALRFDYDIPLAAKLSMIQVGISSIVLLIFSKKSISSKLGLPTYKSMHWLLSKKEKAFYKLIFTLSFIFFLLPIVAIVTDGLRANLLELFSQKGFQRALYISLLVAFLSSFFAIFISLLLSFAKANFSTKRAPNKTILKVVTLSGSLYLMIPSMVLALGFFIILREFSFSFGSIAFIALIFGNTLLTLPFSINALYPKIQRIFLVYDKLTFSIGVKTFDRAKYIYLPLLKRELSYIFALSFSFSLGDLSIIALFGNQDIITLPWYLYQKMGSYQTDDASGVALVLLTIVFTLFYLSSKAKNAHS